MSHYKPYPAYKDSGVEWIGAVPEDWQVARIKRFSSLRNERCTDAPEGWRYIGLEDVESGTGQYRPTEGNSRQNDDSTVGVFRSGDVLYGKLRPYLRKAIVSDSDGVCSTEFLVMKPVSIMASWLHQWLLTTEVTQQIEAGCEGTKMPRADWEHVGSIHVPSPGPSEQAEIVSVLNREISRIDGLITKKTRFIELLKEKRQALITHAVTKGLDPNVKMKDSGVEWIGDIPVYWLVAQLGKISIARCDGPFGSGLKSEHYQPDGVRVIRLQNIGWASFKDGNEAFISHEHWQDVLGGGHEVLPNDVLIGGLGDDKNPLGRACVAPANLGPAMVKADCYRFRLNKSRAVPEFIALALSATARSECGYLATGATRDRLNLGLASARVVALPPRNEQVEIVASLNRDTARIDLLSEKTQRSIDLLKERRSALIMAAVTGQIDLRESV
jgi:type I restriction enzyme S subunit